MSCNRLVCIGNRRGLIFTWSTGQRWKSEAIFALPFGGSNLSADSTGIHCSRLRHAALLIIAQGDFAGDRRSQEGATIGHTCRLEGNDDLNIIITSACDLPAPSASPRLSTEEQG